MKKVFVSILILLLPFLLVNVDAKNRRKNAKDCPVKYYIETMAGYPIEGFVDSIRGELAKYMDYVMTEYDHYDPRSVYYNSALNAKFFTNGSPLKLDTLRVFITRRFFDFEWLPEYRDLTFQTRINFRDFWNEESGDVRELNKITRGKAYDDLSTKQKNKILEARLVDFISPEDMLFICLYEKQAVEEEEFPEAFVHVEIFP